MELCVSVSKGFVEINYFIERATVGIINSETGESMSFSLDQLAILKELIEFVQRERK